MKRGPALPFTSSLTYAILSLALFKMENDDIVIIPKTFKGKLDSLNTTKQLTQQVCI